MLNRLPVRRRKAFKRPSGVILERGDVFITTPAWDAVQRLCNSYDLSISKMIEILVLDADAIHSSQED